MCLKFLIHICECKVSPELNVSSLSENIRILEKGLCMHFKTERLCLENIKVRDHKVIVALSDLHHHSTANFRFNLSIIKMGLCRTARVSTALLLLNAVLGLPLPRQSFLHQHVGSNLISDLQSSPADELWNDTSLPSPQQFTDFVPIRELDPGPELTGLMMKGADLTEKIDKVENIDLEENESTHQEKDLDPEKNAAASDEDTKPSMTTSNTSGKGSNPFQIRIENSSYYGGLITYSHELHPARICRLMNACVRPDGTLVLPKWMKRYDGTINFHCGHPQLEFSLEDTSPPPSLKRYDLVGLHRPRPSMPDFIRDFMPSAIVFDLVYGDHHVTKSCHSRKGKNCDIFPVLTQDFRPSVYLHPRLQEMDMKMSWVRQFIRLMKPSDSGKHAKVTYLEGPGGDAGTMQCYRSALFTRGPYNKNFIAKDHLRDIHFLQQNGIGKRARNVLRMSSRRGKEQKICNLNVTISNRKLVDGARNRLVGRYIVNIPQLRKAIVNQAKRISGLRIKIATMTLEGRSLWWQINAMQKTDIWIAGHGSLLTNMVFLRENSTVMEIQPFTYYPQGYEKMAKHLAYVNYDRYIAHPDLEGFKACMLQLYPKKHASHQKALELLDKYSKAAEKYAQSDSTHSMVLTNFKDTSLHHVKTCAQMQRLDTNAKNLAVTIVRHARLRCGFPKPSYKTKSRAKRNK